MKVSSVRNKAFVIVHVVPAVLIPWSQKYGTQKRVGYHTVGVPRGYLVRANID